jgi:hypothetical protein
VILRVALVALAGCTWGAPPCAGLPEEALAPGVTCADVAPVETWVEALAGRALSGPQRGRMHGELAEIADREPAALREVVELARRTLAELDAGDPRARARLRGALAWDALHGPGERWPRARLPETTDVLDAAVSAWAHADADRLVLPEADVEAWIGFVSLLREVQGGGPLRLAVADRVGVYRQIVARWEGGSGDERVAFLVLGASWPAVRARWQAASYDAQQGWIRAAPLPPPMTEDSRGYLAAVTRDADVVRHVEVLEQRLGPFPAFVP